MGRYSMSLPGDSEIPKKTEAMTREERQRATQGLSHPRTARVGKDVGAEHVAEHLSRDVEDIEMEHIDPNEEDSGEIETLPDGSLSIPILEEELVVTKRVVVRERIIIRKRIQKEQVLVEADLRKERVSIVADPEVELPTGDAS
jgi:stress response protein YsnF